MDSLISFATVALGFTLMIVGADRLIKGAVDFALRMNLSKAFVGAVLVGFGTSAPELFASLFSAFSGEGVLAAGNVIGSNIFNSTLVMGTCMIFPFALTKFERSWKSLLFVLLPAVLIFVFLSDLHLQRWEGLLLLIPLPFFVLHLLKQGPDTEEMPEQPGPLWRALLWSNLGILFLSVGARVAIHGSLQISENFGLSKNFAGAVILAAGTGLPELVTTLVAGFKKEISLAYANIVGSNALNAFAVLGLSGLLFPFKVEPVMLNPNIILLLGVSLFLVLIAFVKRPLWIKAFSAVLFAVYCGFMLMTV